MKPYYKNDLTTIYHGDCLEVMDYLIKQGIKVDAIITDPPYGMSFQSNVRNIKYEKIINDDNLYWLPNAIKLYYELLNDDSPIYMFCSWHNVDIFKQEIEKKFKIKNIIVWEKNGGYIGDIEGAYGNSYELCIYATKGRVLLNGKRERDIIKSNKTGNIIHPTQKPLDLIQYIINKSTNTNDIILDSFAGSFTTCVAAEQLNRRSIGIELEKKYCDIGIKRLKSLQLRLDI